MYQNIVTRHSKPSADRTGSHTIAALLAVAAVAGSLVGAATAAGQPVAGAASTQQSDSVTTYHTVKVDGLSIFYREAGPKSAQTLLLGREGEKNA
jgi:hypothetical protein